MQKPITVSCDASPKGVGRELLKDDCPVAYTNRSLTEAESRYAHIKKETLSSFVQPGAIQPMHVWKESSCRIRSQAPRNKIEKALSNGASQTTDNSTENVKVRLYPRIQTGKELVPLDMLSLASLPETAKGTLEKAIVLIVHLIQSNVPAW